MTKYTGNLVEVTVTSSSKTRFLSQAMNIKCHASLMNTACVCGKGCARRMLFKCWTIPNTATDYHIKPACLRRDILKVVQVELRHWNLPSRYSVATAR